MVDGLATELVWSLKRIVRVRFQVPTAVTVMSTVLWDVTLCSLLDACRRFGETCSSDLKLEVVCSSDTIYLFMKVDFLDTDPEVPGSIPGTTRFSEK
jgi:hypothetical protein